MSADTWQRNEDWLRTRTWDFPGVGDLPALLAMLGVEGRDPAPQRAALAHFMGLPAWEAAPEGVRSAAAAFMAGGTAAAAWRSALHPRDEHGRFARVPSKLGGPDVLDTALTAATADFRRAGIDASGIKMTPYDDPRTLLTAARGQVLVGPMFSDDAALESRRREWRGLDIASTGAGGLEEYRRRLLVHELVHALRRRAEDTGGRAVADSIAALGAETITWRDLGVPGEGVLADKPFPRWQIDSLGGRSAYANESPYEWFAEAGADGVLNGADASPSGKRAVALLREGLSQKPVAAQRPATPLPPSRPNGQAARRGERGHPSGNL
jgi:hypothetical protein